MTERLITSLQNPHVKEVVRLQQKSHERKRQKIFLVEGVREVSLALQAGFKPVRSFICPEIYKADPAYPVATVVNTYVSFQVSTEVYNKMAYRKDAEGIIMQFAGHALKLESLKLKPNPLLIVLEGVEKPGNLGAVLRTADAAGADAVIICDPHTDLFNPNVVRSSLGTIFTNQVVTCSSHELISWAKKMNITLFPASLQSQNNYTQASYLKGTALVFGTEAHGLSDVWYHPSHEPVKIPMLGKTDSLNVSASVAVLVYEAQRQRGFPQE